MVRYEVGASHDTPFAEAKSQAEHLRFKVESSNENASQACRACPAQTKQLLARDIVTVVWDAPSAYGLLLPASDTYALSAVTRFRKATAVLQEPLWMYWQFSTRCYNVHCPNGELAAVDEKLPYFKVEKVSVMPPFLPLRKDDPVFDGVLKYNPTTEALLGKHTESNPHQS